ncbi:MAG: HDOD domain-containing protein [Symbiobacteriia bacterium]
MTQPDLVAKILREMDDLPPMPSGAARVLAMVGDPRTDLDDLVSVVGGDIALSARVLKLANSAYYGFPRQVATLREAIVIMGMNTLKELVITAWSYEMGRRPLPGYALDGGELWRHSLLCGAAARQLAKQVRFPTPEEAYVAGLLHDFGKLVLAQYVGQEYQDLLENVEKGGTSFVEAERRVLGIDHAQLGGQLALKWNLPLNLAEAIANHHQPAMHVLAGHVLDPGNAGQLTALVHVADAVVLMLGIGIGVDGLAYPLEQQALDALGLSEEGVVRLVTEISSLVESDSLKFDL